jgi:nucleoside-diphosphate-sugar epimerase
VITKGDTVKILLTGTDSKLGRLLAEHLGGHHKVTATDGSVDIRDPEVVRPLVSDIDVIVHAGAIWDLPGHSASSEAGILDWSARSAFVLLDEAVKAGLSRAVLVSTLVLFDDYPEGYVLDETFKPKPRAEAVSLATLLAERIFREFARQGPIHTMCLRFGDLDTQEGTPTSMALESVSRAVEAKIESDGYRWGVYNVAGTERYPLRAAKGLPLQLGRVT